jgi:hypothetical protein
MLEHAPPTISPRSPGLDPAGYQTPTEAAEELMNVSKHADLLPEGEAPPIGLFEQTSCDNCSQDITLKLIWKRAGSTMRRNG